MKRKLVIFSTLLVCYALNTQNLSIDWQNTIGGTGDELLRAIKENADGSFLIGGSSDSGVSADKTDPNKGGYDYWILKMESTGNIIWQKTIGGSSDDVLRSIDITTDGGYIIGGESYSDASGDKTENSNGGRDFWVVKIDSNGVIQWQNTIGGNNDDRLLKVLQTSDGGYFLAGISDSDISGDKTEDSLGFPDYWVVRLDSKGTVLWDNTIGGDNWDLLLSADITNDGGFILTGGSKSNSSGDKTENTNGDYDYWVVKLDANGTIEWQNTIGGSGFEVPYSIRQTHEGGYIVVGNSQSNISGDKTEDSNGLDDFWVVKLDNIGTIEWQNTLGGWDRDYYRDALDLTQDGGYILAGHSRSTISGDINEDSQGSYDYWVIYLDSLGNLVEQNMIGGNALDEPWAIFQASDGGFVVAGDSTSGMSGDKTEDNIGGSRDYWILKLTSLLSTNDHVFENSIAVYPNPSANYINIDVNTHRIKSITIASTDGKIVTSITNVDYYGLIKIDIRDLGKGLYILTLESDLGKINKKIIKK